MIRIPLTRGFEAIVDDEDGELVSRYMWQAGGSDATKDSYATYVRHTPDGVVHIAMHRLIMGAGAGQLVDHRDGNGLNNARENLRVCTYLQNNRNRAAYVRRKRAAGGFLGASFHRASGLWHAVIHAGAPDVNGEARGISLRYYATAEEAGRAYDAAARYYFGEFASLNFPLEDCAPFDPSLYGRRLCGSRNPAAKLSDEAVREIRSSGEPLRVMAERFGISISVASVVRTGKAWRHVA